MIREERTGLEITAKEIKKSMKLIEKGSERK